MILHRFESLVRRLVLILGLGTAGVGAMGCDAGDQAGKPPPGSVNPPVAVSSGDQGAPAPQPVTTVTVAELEADITAHLARLQALQMVSVQRLVLDLPSEATACYGPCSSAGAEILKAEYQRQATRLALLTELGESIARSEDVVGVDPNAVAPDLAALGKLAIVELGGLLTVQPATSPQCYNLPCPDDISRAEAENRRRAGVVHELATEATAQNL